MYASYSGLSEHDISSTTVPFRLYFSDFYSYLLPPFAHELC